MAAIVNSGSKVQSVPPPPPPPPPAPAPAKPAAAAPPSRPRTDYGPRPAVKMTAAPKPKPKPAGPKAPAVPKAPAASKATFSVAPCVPNKPPSAPSPSPSAAPQAAAAEGGFLGFAKAAGKALASAVKPAAQAVTRGVQDAAAQASKSGVWGRAKELGGELAASSAAAASAVRNAVQPAIDSAKVRIGSVGNALRTRATEAAQRLSAGAQQAVGAATSAGQGALDVGRRAMESASTGAQSLISLGPKLGAALKTASERGREAVKPALDLVKTAGQRAKEVGRGALNVAQAGLRELGKGASQALQSAANRARNLGSAALDGLARGRELVATGLRAGAQRAAALGNAAIQNAANGIGTAATMLREKALPMGKALLRNGPIGPVALGVAPGLNAAVRGADWQKMVDALPSADSPATRRITGSALLEGGLAVDLKADKQPGGAEVGGANAYLTGQVAANYDITVKRDSDQAQSAYTVRYAKEIMGAVGPELGLRTQFPSPSDKFSPQTHLFARGDGTAAIGSVAEMRFSNKQDAVRAAQLLEKVTTADLLDRAVDVQDYALDAALRRPTLKAPNQFSPLSQFNPSGTSDKAEMVGLQPAEIDWLKQHKVAEEVSSSWGARLSGEARAQIHAAGMGKGTPNGDFDRAGVGGLVMNRFQNTDAIRVELPQGNKPGRLIESETSSGTLFNRQRLFNTQKRGVLGTQGRADRNSIPTEMSTTLSRELPIAVGSQVTQADLDAPQIPANAATSVSFKVNDGASQTLQKYAVAADKAAQVRPSHPLDSGFGAAYAGAAQAGTRTQQTRQVDRVRYDDMLNQSTVRAELPIHRLGRVAAELSLTGTAYVDGLSKLPAASPQSTKPVPRSERPRASPPLPRSENRRVLPTDGVRLRSSPKLAKDNLVGVVQNGNYLTTTGREAVKADGHTWEEVVVRDVNDKSRRAWMATDVTQAYDRRLGQNDAVGRINPSMKQRAVKVREGDSLWTIARRNGSDFEAIKRANAHIVRRGLIFADDTVYLP